MADRIDPQDLNGAAFRYFASVCAAAARLEPAPALPSGVSAAALMALAMRHRIAAPVLDRLAQATQGTDTEGSAALAARARDHRMAALRHVRQVTELSRMLAAHSIRHLVIKGAVLAQQLYGDLAARDSKDIDLLVDPLQFDEAETAFRDAGYAEAPDQAEVAGEHGAKHKTFRASGIEVEVHSRLLDTLDFVPLPFMDVWARRVAVTLGSATLETLSPVDTLLYLSAHGGEHCWFRLKWLQDIARIVVAGDPEVVPATIAVASRDGYDRLVGAAIALVDDLFGTRPTSGTAQPTDQATRRLVALSKDALAAPAELASDPTLGWLIRRSGVQIGLRRAWRGRAAFIRHLFTSPRSFDAGQPATGSRWLGYLSRPVRLFRHHHARATTRRPG